MPKRLHINFLNKSWVIFLFTTELHAITWERKAKGRGRKQPILSKEEILPTHFILFLSTLCHSDMHFTYYSKKPELKSCFMPSIWWNFSSVWCYAICQRNAMICLRISLIWAPRLLSVTVENNATMMPSCVHDYLHSYMQSSHAKSIFSKTLQVSPQMYLYKI